MKNLQNFIRIYHFEDILQFASDSAKCRMMNFDNILQFAEFMQKEKNYQK